MENALMQVCNISIDCIGTRKKDEFAVILLWTISTMFLVIHPIAPSCSVSESHCQFSDGRNGLRNQRRLSILFVRKSFVCEAMVLPSHSLPPASLLCYRPPPVLQEFLAPHFSRWRCKFCISASALRPLWIHGVFVALSRLSSNEVKAPTLSDCYKFPSTAYSDTFGTREKCNYSQMYFMEGHQGHTNVCIIVADITITQSKYLKIK